MARSCFVDGNTDWLVGVDGAISQGMAPLISLFSINLPYLGHLLFPFHAVIAKLPFKNVLTSKTGLPFIVGLNS